MPFRNHDLAMFVLLALPCAPLHAGDSQDGRRVLTALQSTYSLTSALAENTRFDVVHVGGTRVRMSRLAAHLEKDAARFDTQANAAVAAVGVRGIWAADPLYVRVRRVNIRVVEIDAALPFEPQIAGVALRRNPQGGWSPHVWLSPTNGIRMAELIGADLRRLAPQDAGTIDANLDRLKRRLFEMKRAADDCLAGAPSLAVILLADEFEYLADAMNIEVADRFYLPEDGWDAGQLGRLGQAIRGTAAGVVIDRWQPADALAAAITQAGAKVLVLDPLDPGIAKDDGSIDPQGYLRGMESNLAGLCSALTPQNP